jgi:hypothetical protein
MKSISAALLCLLLCSACARLPAIHAPSEGSPGLYTPSDCLGIYPQGDWQFVHIIQAIPPNRQHYTMTGVVRMSSEKRTMHCVVLTLEGLVLFEAQIDTTVSVLRALPPFDAPGFARGLVEDLMLIFLPPDNPPETWGKMAGGAFVCRYPEKSGGTRDVVLPPAGPWEVRRYSDRGCLKKALKADNNRSIPDHLILKTHGVLGYDLALTLVEAEHLSPETSIEKAAP